MFKHIEQMHGERIFKFILIYIWIELAFHVDINQIQIMKRYQ